MVTKLHRDAKIKTLAVRIPKDLFTRFVRLMKMPEVQKSWIKGTKSAMYAAIGSLVGLMDGARGDEYRSILDWWPKSYSNDKITPVVRVPRDLIEDISRYLPIPEVRALGIHDIKSAMKLAWKLLCEQLERDYDNNRDAT
ncbi:MAG TPA: hypothetical protein VKM55_29560 [Candidatus Lokiarchaeia archaeon]|nr:hypothetical protein [Candidatus Lokiarchaeia archaeon]